MKWLPALLICLLLLLLVACEPPQPPMEVSCCYLVMQNRTYLPGDCDHLNSTINLTRSTCSGIIAKEEARQAEIARAIHENTVQNISLFVFLPLFVWIIAIGGLLLWQGQHKSWWGFGRWSLFALGASIAQTIFLYVVVNGRLHFTFLGYSLLSVVLLNLLIICVALVLSIILAYTGLIVYLVRKKKTPTKHH